MTKLSSSIKGDEGSGEVKYYSLVTVLIHVDMPGPGAVVDIHPAMEIHRPSQTVL